MLHGAVVITCDEEHSIYDPGDVVFDDDRILYVGQGYSGEVERRYSAAGRLLMPGLINAHTHTPMSIFRGLADDVDLQVFLLERVWPREIRLTPEDVYAGSVLSAVEMLKSGVTTYVDMYFWEEALLQAALDVGMRAVITPGILDVPAWQPILGHWEQRTQDVIDFCRRWRGHEGRIETGLGPHAPYTLPLPALVEIAQEARRADLRVHIHLVETKQERDAFNARGDGSTARVLEGVGFFDAPTLAAHSVWLDEGDSEIYARHAVGVGHCPQSNAKLGAGIAPVAAMLGAGVQVGLGTDGAATNNNLDVWEELRLAPLLAKTIALDPKAVPARKALWMATRMGGKAIHQPNIGVLAEGYKADIIMLDARESTFVPVFELSTYVDHLVYAAGREAVRSAWINGRQVLRDREVLTVDEEEVRAAAQRAAIRVSERVLNR